MTNKRYLTLEETAELTGLSLHYIYGISAQNRLPGKITWGSRTIRVDRLVLEEWLNKQAAAVVTDD
ncbi:MAG: helix-turn-helix transcriptional regulator [Candidatus Aquicultorales bacterium]